MNIVRLPSALLPLLLVLPGAMQADSFEDALRAADAGRYGEAAAAFHSLALTGDGAAAHNLAALFATGRGLPQNDAEALYWAWRARLSGIEAVQVLLDRLWPATETARKDAIATRLTADLEPLAEAGDGAAMLELAAVLGVVRPKPDTKAAYSWQSIAAALEVPGAQAARDATLSTFAPGERGAVQDAALAAFRDWCGRQPPETRPVACAVVVASASG